MDDSLLVARIQNGEETGLDCVIDTYTSYVATIIYNIMGSSFNNTDIEEAVADVFSKLWFHRHRLKPDRPLKGYLAATARNTAIDYLRKAKASALPLNEDVVQMEDTTARQIETQEFAFLLNEILAGFDKTSRSILLRYYYYYEPTAVIATALGMQEAAVRARLSRGRKKLKQSLTERGYSHENGTA